MDTPFQKIDVLDTYSVFIGCDLIQQINTIINIKNYSKVFFVSDKTVASRWVDSGPLSQFEGIFVESGEQAKNINSVTSIWKQLLEKKADRKSLVLNVGGGVIGDMGGFAAATYMRGISFIQIPTTLLAQVDASVGGKLAIDFGGVKNSIGSFVQPKAVLIDVRTLSTLPERILVEGFGEIIKHGIIADDEYFLKATSKKPGNFSESEMIKIISRSVEIKSRIVKNDVNETGDRKKLNFGHTVGHALESLSLESEMPLLHGEAVSLGMMAEAEISRLKGLLPAGEVTRIRQALSDAGLPVTINIKNPRKVIEKMASDKKSVGGNIRWTLVTKIGNSVIDQSVDKGDVLKALELISN